MGFDTKIATFQSILNQSINAVEKRGRVTTLRFVIPAVCEPAFALQNRAELAHQVKKQLNRKGRGS